MPIAKLPNVGIAPPPPPPPPGPTGAFLANLTFQNTSGSATPAASYVAFGQAFRKGDLPVGSVPQLRLQDGTLIPAQFDLRNTWPDGSLRWCEISCVLPSIAANDVTYAYIYQATGTYDNAQRRALTDVNAVGGHAFQVVISNCTTYDGTVYNGGTMTAAFNTASAVPANTDLVKSGPICDQWRTWMFFPGQQNLLIYFYVTAWTDQSGGGLATISHIAKVHNGCINVAGITKLYYDATYSDGASVIRQFGGASTEKQFTYQGTNNELTCNAHGLQSGTIVTVRSTGTLPPGSTVDFTVDVPSNTFAGTILGNECFLTTTGTLPSPLVTTKTYYPSGSFGQFYTSPATTGDPSSLVTLTSGGSGTHTMHFGLVDSVKQAPGPVYYVNVVDANTIQLADIGGNAGGVPITGNGTPTNFVQPRIFHHHHSSWYTARGDGKSDWTSNEATIFVAHDQNYLLSTRMIPPYDMNLALNPATPIPVPGTPINQNGTTQYYPMGIGDIRPAVTNESTHPMIGPLPGWCAQAFLSNHADFAQVARANALFQCSWNVWVNEATGKVPTVCGNSNFGASGSFAGLGTPFHTAFFTIQGDSPGQVVTPTGGPGPWQASGGTRSSDWSHNPDCHHYTIVTEGGAHLIDSQILYTGGGPWGTPNEHTPNNDWYFNQVAGGRNQQVNPSSTNFYHGILNNQGRSIGWQLRSFAHARATIPDSWAEQSYFDFYLKNNAAYASELIATGLSAVMVANGWWFTADYFTSYTTFAHGFIMRSCCHAYYLFEDPSMKTWADQMLRYYSKFMSDWPGQSAAAFNALGWYCNSAQSSVLPPPDNRSNYLPMTQMGTYYGTGNSDGCSIRFDFNGAIGGRANSLIANYSRGSNSFIQFPLNNGDKIIMTLQSHDNSPSFHTYTLPTGLNFNDHLFIVNLTGSEPSFNFQLSTTYPTVNLVTFSDNGDSNYNGPFFEFAMIPSVPPTALADLNANNPTQEAFGELAQALQCGFTDAMTAYNAIMVLNQNTGMYTNPVSFPVNPVWCMRPWMYQPGIIRYVNPQSVGGDGTTPALTGANAAYKHAAHAEQTEARNLTGTGGITFWCAGGLDDCSTEAWSDTTRPRYHPLPNPNFWITTVNDPIRFMGNPSVIDGRNFGPNWSPQFYYFSNTGPGAPEEPGGGLAAGTNTGNIIYDGCQVYDASTDSVGEAWYLHPVGGTSTRNVTIRNCRTLNYQDNLQHAGGGSGSRAVAVTCGESGANILFENCVFEGRKLPGAAVQGFSVSGPITATVNYVNCTMRGYTTFLISEDGAHIINFKNCCMFDLLTDEGGNPGIWLFNSAGATYTYTNCATKDSLGSNPQSLATSTQWNANFVGESANTVHLTGNYWYQGFDDIPTPYDLPSIAVGLYQVKNTSAAIYGAGTASGAPAYDITGRKRKAIPDIGAFER